jgi:hypothetical protein
MEIHHGDGPAEGGRRRGRPPRGAEKWRQVRVPEWLAERLERLRDETRKAHVEGRIKLPSAFADKPPLWLIIERALNEQEDRRKRSRRSRKPQPRPTKNDGASEKSLDDPASARI